MSNQVSRKVFKFVGVPLIAGSLLLSLTPAIAGAGTTGGTGGGGGPYGGTGQHWVSVADGTNTYQRFLNEQPYQKRYVEDYLTRTGASINTCKQSNVIWFVRSGNNGKWSWNYTGATYGTNSNVIGGIADPATVVGRTPTRAEFGAFTKWDSEENGEQRWDRPGYTIICNGYFNDKPDRVRKDVLRDTNTTDSKKVREFTRPYAYTTSVSEQVDPHDKLNPQSETVRTNFADLYDGWKNNDNRTATELSSQTSRAQAKDKDLKHAEVTLNNGNQRGMHAGGVLNVHEHVRLGTIRTETTTTTTKRQYCDFVETWNKQSSKYNPGKYVNCETKTSTEETSRSSKHNATQQNTGFWQMLGVQCNADGFNNLKSAATDATVLQNIENGSDTPGVIRSKKYNGQPNTLDFGDASNGNAAKAATADNAFFTEECSFECIAEPNSALNNGSKDNVRDSSVRGNDNTSGYGAFTEEDGEKINDASFNQFRNGESSHYNLDVWYPSVDGLNRASYDGSAAHETRWIINEDGTPEADATFKDPRANKTLRHGDVTSVPGFSRILDASSTWASDEGKPHNISTIWNYDVNTTTTIPARVGFGTSGSHLNGTNPSLSTTGKLSRTAPVDAVCYASYNGVNEKATQETTDNAQTPGDSYEDLIRKNGEHDGQYELEVNFPRSVAEGDNH